MGSISAIHTAKLGVHVRVMRLEPIAEGAAQHAGGRMWGAALHHEVTAIKKIRRISRIEGKGNEARKGLEDRGRPFPAVAEEIVDAKGTLAGWMGVDGMRGEICEVEIAEFGRWRRITPRIIAFHTPLGRKSSAMPFGFCGKPPPGPSGIG